MKESPDFRRTGRTLQIGEVIKGTLERLGLERKVQEYSVWLFWQKAAGEKIARHARPQQIIAGKLLIGVDSSAWMNELHLIKKKLIRKINQETGKNIVKDIHFKLQRIGNER